MRSSRPVLPMLALAAFAVYLAASLSHAAIETVRDGVLLYRVRGETPFQERARTYGQAYAREIEAIRRAIPRDGAYILINGDPADPGGPLWVKFDLAQRRTVYLGELGKLGSVERLKKRMPRAARWVVIAYGTYGRPVLVERYRFVRELKGGKGA